MNKQMKKNRKINDSRHQLQINQESIDGVINKSTDEKSIQKPTDQ